MNDFTKQELERILEGITWWLDGDTALYCETLINKLQSMIDLYDTNVVQVWHCEKCGHVQ